MPQTPEISDVALIRVTALGAGTSTGVPVIGCLCAVCLSSEPRNKRLRASIAVSPLGGEFAGTTILVDTTPDLRIQALRAGMNHVDAVLMTHHHADHIFGMDDLRQYNYRQPDPIPIYGAAETLAQLRTAFAYAFTEGQMGGGKPRLDLREIIPAIAAPFDVCGIRVTPLPVFHGELPILGYKFGESFAYVTDVSGIPADTMAELYGLDVLILDAVRREPHPTHFSLGEALEAIAELKPRCAYLTHLSHDFDYAATMAELPEGVALAYDGLSFAVPGGAV